MRGRDRIGATLLGIGVFAVYAAGACPTIYVGDSGELVTAVHLLGIPHPTGYPLYVLLGKLWTLLAALRLDRLAHEPLQRRLRRGRLRGALPAAARRRSG